MRQAIMAAAFGLLVSLAALAAETRAPEAAETSDGPAAQEAASANKPEARVDRPVARDRNATAKPTDVFQPSEEISEDFAVSFPVDI